MDAINVRTERFVSRRALALLALCVLLGAALAALALHGPTAHAEVIRCVVWQDSSGNVYADDCQRYSD
ncbi:hypothetical protein AVU99_gp053 [Mycobacterium phage Lolly9]|uniref:Uncharacterized protein n=1 Tax=Mycobacterium phage Lolly9 TaxID=1698711 RepID=A0A0K2FNH0_9CAUD|nr:hypothetical protein AVU99_gp053 [Mycobacterium phage Lolly9]ALA48544.1 hypothetical protein LOLLY9_137 [Mycobacterium phage Lolly9]QOP65853.1 membrane protein [Mycobacterium phage MiniLon]